MPNPYMPQGYGRGGYQDPSTNMGGSGNPRGVYNSPQQSGAYYGPSYPQSYSGQQPGLNRYQPPMMYGSNPNSWTQGGGYSYNLPNSYGHAYNGGYGGIVPQYQYGQGGGDPYGYVGGGQNFMRNSRRGGYGPGGAQGEAAAREQWYAQMAGRTMRGYPQMPEGQPGPWGVGGRFPEWARQLGGSYGYGGDARLMPAQPQGYAKPAVASNPAVPQPVTGSGYDWSTSPLGWPRP